MIVSFAFMRLYVTRPGASRIDELNSVFIGASVGQCCRWPSRHFCSRTSTSRA